MDFPITDLRDEATCYRRLLGPLHPGGLTGPRCAAGADRPTVHRRRQGPPVVDPRCTACRRAPHPFTGTPWQGAHRTPAVIIQILRGFVEGAPTAGLARELKASRPHLLGLRHRAQARAAAAADTAAAAGPRPDAHAEGDEVNQTAGGKRGPAPRPG